MPPYFDAFYAAELDSHDDADAASYCHYFDAYADARCRQRLDTLRFLYFRRHCHFPFRLIYFLIFILRFRHAAFDYADIYFSAPFCLLACLIRHDDVITSLRFLSSSLAPLPPLMLSDDYAYQMLYILFLTLCFRPPLSLFSPLPRHFHYADITLGFSMPPPCAADDFTPFDAATALRSAAAIAD